MTCRSVADFIDDYLSGELAPDVRREFQRHLDLCLNCRRYIALYAAASEAGRRVCANENASAVEAGVPEDLVAAILASRRTSGVSR